MTNEWHDLATSAMFVILCDTVIELALPGLSLNESPFTVSQVALPLPGYGLCYLCQKLVLATQGSIQLCSTRSDKDNSLAEAVGETCQQANGVQKCSTSLFSLE